MIEADSEEEVLRRAGEHVVDYHKVAPTPELVERVRGAIATIDEELPATQ